MYDIIYWAAQKLTDNQFNKEHLDAAFRALENKDANACVLSILQLIEDAEKKGQLQPEDIPEEYKARLTEVCEQAIALTDTIAKDNKMTVDQLIDTVAKENEMTVDQLIDTVRASGTAATSKMKLNESPKSEMVGGKPTRGVKLHGGALTTPAIIGISVGAVGVSLLFLIGLVVWLRKKRQKTTVLRDVPYPRNSNTRGIPMIQQVIPPNQYAQSPGAPSEYGNLPGYSEAYLRALKRPLPTPGYGVLPGNPQGQYATASPHNVDILYRPV